MTPNNNFRLFGFLKIKIVLPVLFTALILMYANCSKVEFGDIPINASGGTTPGFTCSSFVPLNDPMIVPARTTEGICYYRSLFSAQAKVPSGGSTLASVRSKDYDTQMPAAPYIIRSQNFTVTLQGPRMVKLSGTVNPMGPIKVDNFFVINMPSATKAYGTADCALPGTDVITYNNNPVRLNNNGFMGGLATIEPLDVTDGFPLQQSTNVSLWALDCGSYLEVSDVYIVFQ